MLTGNLSLDLIRGGLSSPYWWLFNAIWALTWGTLIFGLSFALVDTAGTKWWTLFLAIAVVPTYFFYFPN